MLVSHGADINKADVDSWTPVHAAAANGHSGKTISTSAVQSSLYFSFSDLLSYLIEAGGKTNVLTEDGESALDLVDCEDLETMAVLLNTKVGDLRKKISLTAGPVRSEPAWVRKESRQEELGKKKISVIAKKHNEISVCQKKGKETATAVAKDPVQTDINNQTERKRRIGQADALSSFVNSKLSQKDAKDRI